MCDQVPIDAHSTSAAVCIQTGDVHITRNRQPITVRGSTYKCKGACAVEFHVPGVWHDLKDDGNERAKFLTAISQKIRRDCKCKAVSSARRVQGTANGAL